VTIILDFSGQICNKTPFFGLVGFGMNDRSNSALIALRRILRVTELNSRTLAQHSELTASQLIVLQRVADEGRMLPSSIAKSVGLQQATITVLVDKLEDAGLVTRQRDTKDRRRVWIEPTPEGRATLDRSPDLLQHRFEARFAELEEWEQSMIIAALERVGALLDASSIDAAPVLDVGDLDRLIVGKQ
jgi:DNA-binding MarR family transcriptional regulator